VQISHASPELDVFVQPLRPGQMTHYSGTGSLNDYPSRRDQAVKQPSRSLSVRSRAQ